MEMGSVIEFQPLILSDSHNIRRSAGYTQAVLFKNKRKGMHLEMCATQEQLL